MGGKVGPDDGIFVISFTLVNPQKFKTTLLSIERERDAIFFRKQKMQSFSANSSDVDDLLVLLISQCHLTCEREKKLVLLVGSNSQMSLADSDEIFISTSLASYLDKKLLVLLRDGRKLMGLLRSFDQFANVILEGACERLIVGDIYCDIKLGLYVIRGENVVLIGELDLDSEELPQHMIRVSEEEILRAQKAEKDSADLKGSMMSRMEFLDFD